MWRRVFVTLSQTNERRPTEDSSVGRRSFCARLSKAEVDSGLGQTGIALHFASHDHSYFHGHCLLSTRCVRFHSPVETGEEIPL